MGVMSSCVSVVYSSPCYCTPDHIMKVSCFGTFGKGTAHVCRSYHIEQRSQPFLR